MSRGCRAQTRFADEISRALWSRSRPHAPACPHQPGCPRPDGAGAGGEPQASLSVDPGGHGAGASPAWERLPVPPAPDFLAAPGGGRGGRGGVRPEEAARSGGPWCRPCRGGGDRERSAAGPGGAQCHPGGRELGTWPPGLGAWCAHTGRAGQGIGEGPGDGGGAWRWGRGSWREQGSCGVSRDVSRDSWTNAGGGGWVFLPVPGTVCSWLSLASFPGRTAPLLPRRSPVCACHQPRECPSLLCHILGLQEHPGPLLTQVAIGSLSGLLAPPAPGCHPSLGWLQLTRPFGLCPHSTQ